MKNIKNIVIFLTAYFYSSLIFALSQYGSYESSAFSKAEHSVLVNWNTEEGKKRLFRSKYNTDLFQLAHHYQPQANPLYCGIASSVMVLNALRIADDTIPSQAALEIQKPIVWGGDKVPYKLYSQATLLNDKTDQVKSQKIIELKNITQQNQNDDSQFDPGLTLAQLKGILEVYNAKVQMYYADGGEQKNIESFRTHLKKILGEPEKFMLINYKSDQVGQAGGGHISPLGAYDAASDSVLMLDVSSYFNPWLWIPVADLYLAMHTKDGDNFRGYLIVQDD